MKNIGVLVFVLLSSVSFSFSQNIKLSPQADIRVITVGPYQGELYSAFGHSGFRVYDREKGIDDFYNYGVFNFNQPNFYLNFARGYLNYQLAVMDYARVRNFYIYQNRYIHEQILNLTQKQKQKLFDFLQWNAKPENMFYYYDYFYDNCATRIRDAVVKTFGDSVRFDGSYVETDYTIRDLTDIYLQQQPWGDLGIDICLGLPMDKKATPYMYMFLPDYVESGFDHAYILQGGKEHPIVQKTVAVYEPKPQNSAASQLTPTYIFWFAAALFLIITFLGYKNHHHKKAIDIVLFNVIGLLGWLLLLLWVATDHKAAATNFNLLWAIPFHFPIAFWLMKKESPRWLPLYFLTCSIVGVITLISWSWLPQDLHVSLIPVTLILTIRSFYIYQNTK